jgi:L-fuculose-phosphate aldolase
MNDFARRLELVEHCKKVALLDGSAGVTSHASVRSPGGMLITPADFNFALLTPSDLCFITVAGDCTGRHAPSPDWIAHRDLYVNRPDLSALIQSQPTHATTLACLSKPIPAFHYMITLAGGKDIRCAPYATFGTQRLADYIVHAFRERKACLIAQSGLLVGGETLPKAYELTLQIEQLATMYLLAIRVGEPALLPDDEVKRVSVKFATGGTLKPGAY